jgi:hypothetical protein
MKRFLMVAAVGVFGAALLIACGGGAKPADSPAGAASGSGSAPAAMDSSAAPAAT